MSFPDSSTVGPVFNETAPDYSKVVAVEMEFLTILTVARKGGEQRSRKRTLPLINHSFQASALNAAQMSRAKADLILEVGAPIVIPVWTDSIALVSMPTINSADLGGSLDTEKFKVNSWAYMTQAGKVSTFRKISGIAGGVLSFTAPDIFPSTGVNNFTAGALVYPCIIGEHAQESAAFLARRVNDSDQVIGIEEL